MERNTLLAIVLSAIVLFTYQALFVPPKQPDLPKNTQPIAAQGIKETNSSPEKILPNKE